MVDSYSAGSENPVCDAMDDGGASIGYPQFSPPGVASSLVADSLPQPLVSLPALPPENQALLWHGQQSVRLRAPSQTAGTLAGGQEATHSSFEALSLRLQHMESLCRDLQREKNVMEDQFGQQRKKFMNLMMQKDEELSQVKRSVEQFSLESQQLCREMKAKEEELQSVLKTTKARESANREAFDADRIKYEEEIASLQRTINEERAEYKKDRALLGSQNFTDKKQRSPSPGDPSMQVDMAKAVQDSEILKAVVVPLEKEIHRLRKELWETKDKLYRAEQQPSTPPLIDLDTALPPTAPSDSLSLSDSQLEHQLKLERSARQDLEMHTGALEQQKSVLQEEVASLQRSLEEVRERSAVKGESYEHLKQTWNMANQHFIVAQDKLQQKVYFMEQKQLLLQQQRDQPTTSDSGLSAQDGRHSPPHSQSLSKRRSYSCDSVRETKGGPQIATTTLENELKRVRQRLEQQTATCESYEAQLQRVQEQMLEELDEKDQELSRLREECSKAKTGVVRERRAKEELRRKMDDVCKQFKAEVESFQSGMQTEQVRLKTLRDQYTQSKHEAQRDLARFSDERVSLFAQISSAQEEYDCLKVVQAEETQKYSQRIREMEQEKSVTEDNVLALRMRLTELEGEKQSSGNVVAEQLAHLREKLQQEERARENMEVNLKQQLEAARNEIAALELVKAELSQEQQMREKAMAARSEVEEKSRSFIADQHQRLEAEVTARQAAEQLVRDLQRQVCSLRTQLNTSQENQRDFVELSQALQMKLAEIEEQKTSTVSSHP